MRNLYLPGLALLASCALTSCFDDKYDLADVDTTSELRLNDLVIPTSIDPILLDDIISLKEDSKVQIVNGEYVFMDDGDFDSDEMNIEPISIAPSDIPSEYTPINKSGTEGSVIVFDIHSNPSHFNYTDASVSEHVLDIDKLVTTLPVTIEVSVSELPSAGSALTFLDLNIQLPKGMTLINLSHGTYDTATGILHIDQAASASGLLQIKADMSALDVKVSPEATFSLADHTFIFDGSMELKDGKLKFNSALIPSYLTQLTLVTKFILGTLDVQRLDGKVKYEYEGLEIDPILLDDLPDILTQEETSIELLNPQIYLNVENPVATYGLSGEASLELTPQREQGPGAVITMPAPFLIQGTQPSSLICLAPTQPAEMYMAGSEWYAYPNLGKILAGNGIPSSIDAKIINANVPPQEVEGLEIGKDLGCVKGTYTFYAPIAFAGGSKIVYSKTQDGWNDEDVDKIVIDRLQVNATATNNAPLDIYLSGYPIDINGNKIEGCEVEGATVLSGEQDAPVTIRLTGKVEHLDGFVYTATMKAPAGNTHVLRPADALSLGNIRVTVSGSYTTDL